MMKEKVISSDRIFDGKAVALRVDTIDKFSGDRITREIVEHSDCIAVVVFDKENNVVLVRQYRRAAEKELLEIPAGCVEDGEDLEDCVKRELQEEIGYLPGEIKKLGGFYAAPGYCTEFMHIFLASDLKESRLVAEDTDEIEVIRVPVSDIPSLIKNGEICDAKSVASLLMAMRLNCI
ncbi:MAG: NUDIX hydrolase [Dehalococcoidia bacterium]|nr:NUDIX hydrolase [Dehalococcoidia bacterium]